MMSSASKIVTLLFGLTFGLLILFFSNFDQRSPASPAFERRGTGDKLAQSSQTNHGYVPPAKDQKQQKATASGSRGCPGKSVNITSLIPTNHTPTTISTHPDFLFSVKSIPNLPVRFSLIEPGVIEPLWKSDIAVNRAGILSVSIPQTVSLDVGKEYVWNLEVVCNPSRPSENWYIRAVIRRVPLKPELAVKLAEANSETEKAVILANNGIWYDAVYYSYKEKNEVDSMSYFKQLLSQIGLTI